MSQRKRRISKIWKTDSDKIRYASLEKLEEKIQQGVTHINLYLTGKLMGVLKKKLPCHFMRSNARNKFRSVIGFGFPVVVYTYETPGRATNWLFLFKVPRGIHTDNPDFI